MAYKPLTDDQVRAVAAEYFKTRQVKTAAQDMPTLLLVGGQPGAGKSAAARLGKAELNQAGGYIHVDADRMRERIPLGADKPTSEQTQADAGRLVGALRELATANKRNIIEEGTFRQPAGAERFIERMQGQGYQVEMLAVATPREESLLGIYQRFEHQHNAGTENPRFVPEVYHDDAMGGFANTLTTAAHSLDRIRVVDRAGQVLFDSRQQGNRQGSAIEALAEGRKLTDDKLAAVTKSWSAVEHAAQQRGAPADYLEAVSGHQQRLVDMQKQRIHGHAIGQLDANLAALQGDRRFANHTGDELGKAAYFRGVHEKAATLAGGAPDFTRYDAKAADRDMLRQLPDVEGLEGRGVKQRAQERDSGLSM